METYNGYTNYETWAVALWIDNEQSTQEYWAEQAQACWDDATITEFTTREQNAVHRLAEQLKEEHEEAMPEVEGVWADLLNAAFGSVDWYDIARTMLGEVDKTDDEEEDEEPMQ